MELSSKILSDITVHMKYAKYIPSLKRRETWEELVARNENMHIKKYPNLKAEIKDAYRYVYDKKVLPSMRALQFSGKPIEISPNRLYNCAYAAIDHPYVFGEIMFLLLGGSGVGFSVQKHHVDKLPEIRKPKKKKRFLIGDSIEGWATAVESLMKSYFKGTSEPDFDYSDIRPKGARLVTSGGKAPGHEPLKECLENIREILSLKNDGDKLTPLEVHDIICMIADAVLTGGIRRAALISVFSFDDSEMLKCKTNFYPEWFNLKGVYPPANGGTTTYHLEYNYRGKDKIKVLNRGEMIEYGLEKIVDNFLPGDGTNSNLIMEPVLIHQGKKKIPIGWWEIAPQRGRANNSALILRYKIKKKEFLNFWKIIKESGSGEPGFFFSNDKEWGLNPCAEISLRSNQFCNLVTINAGAVQTQDDLNAYARAASFIATLQASYTNFHYLRDIWRQTTEKEALIGVSHTGIAGSKIFDLNLEGAAAIVIEENERVAKLLGIRPAARTTTVKPEGTSSLVLGTASGIHSWHDEYYIRSIRVGKNEAIYTYLKIYHPELLADDEFKPKIQAVISVPQKAPEGAILRTESALNLLSRVKVMHDRWIKPGHISGNNTHNVSATISVKPDEWEPVGEWMWDNRDSYNALSVLPYSDHTYVQAPFESCTKQKYNKLMSTLTDIDLTKIVELDDATDLKGEVACGGGSCEIT